MKVAIFLEIISALALIQAAPEGRQISFSEGQQTADLSNDLPEDRGEPDFSQIIFMLYTRNTRDNGQAIDHNQENLGSSDFESSKNTYVLIHGWNSDIDFSQPFKDALLDNNDCNVFGIDWNALESWTNYPAAARTSVQVGVYIGDFVTNLLNDYNVDPNNVHVIGHSLGAQASGHVGRTVNNSTGTKIARISGLDPAKPWFDMDDHLHLILNKNDASFVDVIHVNSGDLFDGCLSFFEPMGHVDFYPNGGVHQPGCTHGCIGGCTDHDLTDLMRGGCSHGKANDYFVESINEGTFTSDQCDSWEAFLNNGCPLAYQELMGFSASFNSGEGKFWCNVNEDPPFHQG